MSSSSGIWQFLCHLPYDALSTKTAYHLFSHSFSLGILFVSFSFIFIIFFFIFFYIYYFFPSFFHLFHLFHLFHIFFIFFSSFFHFFYSSLFFFFFSFFLILKGEEPGICSLGILYEQWIDSQNANIARSVLTQLLKDSPEGN